MLKNLLVIKTAVAEEIETTVIKIEEIEIIEEKMEVIRMEEEIRKNRFIDYR